jgi:hypothetical protein
MLIRQEYFWNFIKNSGKYGQVEMNESNKYTFPALRVMSACPRHFVIPKNQKPPNRLTLSVISNPCLPLQTRGLLPARGRVLADPHVGEKGWIQDSCLPIRPELEPAAHLHPCRFQQFCLSLSLLPGMQYHGSRLSKYREKRGRKRGRCSDSDRLWRRVGERLRLRRCWRGHSTLFDWNIVSRNIDQSHCRVYQLTDEVIETKRRRYFREERARDGDRDEEDDDDVCCDESEVDLGMMGVHTIGFNTSLSLLDLGFNVLLSLIYLGFNVSMSPLLLNSISIDVASV